MNFQNILLISKRYHEEFIQKHLFFTCSFTATIWTNIAKKVLKEKSTEDWDTLVLLISDTTVDNVTLFVIRYLFQLTNHSLWREQNCRRHGEPHSTQGTLISTIEKTVRNRLSTWVLSGYWETITMKKAYVSGSAQELKCERFIYMIFIFFIILKNSNKDTLM